MSCKTIYIVVAIFVYNYTSSVKYIYIYIYKRVHLCPTNYTRWLTCVLLRLRHVSANNKSHSQGDCRHEGAFSFVGIGGRTSPLNLVEINVWFATGT